MESLNTLPLPNSATVRLQSMPVDGVYETFTVPLKAAELIGVVNDKLKTGAMQPLAMPVKSQELRRVIAFCTHHATHPMAEILSPVNTDIHKHVDAWYVDFITSVRGMDAFSLATACDNLRVPHLCSLIAANMTSGYDT